MPIVSRRIYIHYNLLWLVFNLANALTGNVTTPLSLGGIALKVKPFSGRYKLFFSFFHVVERFM